MQGGSAGPAGHLGAGHLGTVDPGGLIAVADIFSFCIQPCFSVIQSHPLGQELQSQMLFREQAVIMHEGHGSLWGCGGPESYALPPRGHFNHPVLLGLSIVQEKLGIRCLLNIKCF